MRSDEPAPDLQEEIPDGQRLRTWRQDVRRWLADWWLDTALLILFVVFMWWLGTWGPQPYCDGTFCQVGDAVAST